MRAAGVAVDPPRLNDGPGRRQALEQRLGQALVARAPVRAIGKAVLLWLAPTGDDPVEVMRDLLVRQRQVDNERQALRRAAVDHDEDTRAVPVVEYCLR